MVLLPRAVWSFEDQGAIERLRRSSLSPLAQARSVMCESRSSGELPNARARSSCPSGSFAFCLLRTVAKMLRLVNDDLDDVQPHCRHLRLVRVALESKFVPCAADEVCILPCKAEVSHLPSWAIASSRSSVYELPLHFFEKLRRLSFIEHRMMMLACMQLCGICNKFFHGERA